MPKSSKKRKSKAADFTKAKLKLGKEKKAPSNVVDTSFKARSIALPTQSITVVKDGNTPTTKRNLTIDDLLAHLKHYSPSVKRDTFTGLTELLGAHWDLAGQHLSHLINHLARIISDEDAGVRKQLLAFLSWLLPRLPREDLVPHATTLLLFTASAQTHIFPEIRIDAMRFLTLFLEHIPEPIVEGWNAEGPSHGKRILEGYLVNLNAGTIYGNAEGPPMAFSTPSVIISPMSKLAVLQSFSSFLRAGISVHSRNATYTSFNVPLNAWFMSQSFGTREAFKNFESALSPSLPTGQQPSDHRRAQNDSSGCPQHYPLVEYETPWTMQEIEGVVTSSGGLPDGMGAERSVETFLSQLSRTIHPILVSTILDYAPSVFAPDGKGGETEASAILEISQIASLLYGTILGGAKTAPVSSLSELDELLSYMTPYFPFSSSSSETVKFSQSFQDLDLIYCELTSLLVLHANLLSAGSSLHSRKIQNRTPKPNNTLRMQVALVSEYIVKLLRGEGTTTSQIPHSLSATSYHALLPSIWAIISELSSHATDVTQALLDHATKTSSKSSVKRLTTEFLAHLMLLETEPQYKGVFRVGANNIDQVRQQFENWLTNLPRVLWEIGNSDPIATEVILRFFLRLFQRRSSFLQSKTISTLALRLVPYFLINHPVRGHLSGPYSKLPSTQAHLRRLCLDVVVTFTTFGRLSGIDASEACGALSEAVDLVIVDTNEEEYWTHVNVGTRELPHVKP